MMSGSADLEAEASAGLFAEGSFDSSQYDQKFHVPFKMRSANARDAVELLLRLSDGDPITLLVSVSEHMCQKFRGRFPNAEVLLKKILHLRASDQMALEGSKRASRIASSTRRGAPGKGRPQTVGTQRVPLAARNANDVRPQTVGAGAAGVGGATVREVGAVLPLGPASSSSQHSAPRPPPPPSSSSRAQAHYHSRPSSGAVGFGYVGEGTLQLPPLEDGSYHAGKEQHFKSWMQEKKKKEKKRDDARWNRAQADKKWIAQLAEVQTQRNRQRKLEQERNDAASKIQGLYRGHSDRKMMKTLREERKRTHDEKKRLGPSTEELQKEAAARLFD